MRHSRLYGIMTGMLSCMLVLSVSSCVKDDFDRYQNASDALSFKVEVSEGWSDGTASSSTSIRRMSQSADAEPLYLVTKVYDSAPVSAPSGAVTRGTPVENKNTLETNGFGLSAICYTGSWPEDAKNDWTTNFAHNLKVAMTDGELKASEKLEWPGSGHIKFFAYYPHSDNSGGCITHSGSNETGVPELTYTVPTDVKKQPDLLWAVAEHSGKSDGNSVTLKFQHALTAVRIKCGKNMLAGKISKVEISGVYGKGTMAIGTNTWVPSGLIASYTISEAIDLPTDDKSGDIIHAGQGTPIAGTDTDNLTFMLLPQKLPGDAKMTIEFTDAATNTPRTLTASIAGQIWDAGKTVTYSVSPSSIDITPKVNLDKKGITAENPTGDIMPYSGVWYDAKYTAEVEVTQVGVDTKTIEIPADKIKFQYRFKDSDPWVECTTDTDGLLKIAPQTAYETMRNGFDTVNETGFESSPTPLTVDGQTANCYLVDKAGYFSLPLVYGNGNVSEPYDNTNGLKYYPKHDDGEMPADGKISGVADAVLCWQDAPDLIDPASVKVANGNLVFHIRKHTLTQGNALLAVRNDLKEIIWSWHIWVTPYKEEFYGSFYNSSADGYSYNLAKYNLGWCDGHDHNDSRTFSLQAIVDMSAYGGGKEIPVNIGTFTQDVFKGSDAGDNTYYQWGRKDPMLGGIYNTYTKEYQYNKKGGNLDKVEFTMENKQVFNQYNDGYNYSFCKNPGDMIEPLGEASKGVTIGYAIQHPYMFVTNSKEHDTAGHTGFSYRNHWHIPYADKNVEYLNDGTHIMFNVWNSEAKGAGDEYKNINSDQDKLKYNAEYGKKSVYDPCPPGFQVPPIHAFQQIVRAMNSAASSYSDNAWTITDTGGSITFPMTGVRNYALRENEWKTVTPNGSSSISDYEEFRKEFYKISMPAFRMLTFVSSATIVKKDDWNAHQVYILRIDRNNRVNAPGKDNLKTEFIVSSNSYGLPVRPMHYTETR